MNFEIGPNAVSLFELTRSRVTPEHIEDFSPTDPGYEDYVRTWTELWRTGQIPTYSDFEFSEVIGLTGWCDARRLESPERFREYRRFTSAVAVALIHNGNEIDIIRPANYLARDFLIDSDPRQKEHFDLVRPVLLETRDVLKNDGREPGYPFFTLAAMILSQQAGEDDFAVQLAENLLEEENAVRVQLPVWDDRFLFGLTNYDQLNRDWIAFIRTLKNPTGSETMDLVIQKLNGRPPLRS